MTITRDTVKTLTEQTDKTVENLQAKLQRLEATEKALDRKLTLLRAKRLKTQQKLEKARRKAQKIRTYANFYSKELTLPEGPETKTE